MLLEPYGLSSPPYIESKMELTLVGSETPYPLMKTLSLMNRSTKRTQRLANQHCFPFKTNGRKYGRECPIHRIINSCAIEGAYSGRVLSIFWRKKKKKKNIITFSEEQNKRKHFCKFERWIFTCFIVAVFRFFTILCFMKNRHNPCWSVRTLAQYICIWNLNKLTSLVKMTHWLPTCLL